MSDLPKYMSDVLQFSIKDNGIYSSLPYLLMWIVSVSTGFLSDYLIVKKFLTITQARKVFTGVGMFYRLFTFTAKDNVSITEFHCIVYISLAAVFPAFLIVAASYAGCNKFLVVVWFTLAMGFMGTFYPGND